MAINVPSIILKIAQLICGIIVLACINSPLVQNPGPALAFLIAVSAIGIIGNLPLLFFYSKKWDLVYNSLMCLLYLASSVYYFIALGPALPYVSLIGLETWVVGASFAIINTVAYGSGIMLVKLSKD